MKLWRFIVVFTISLTFSLRAQTDHPLKLDSGVKPHNEIDAMYRVFSQAYDQLDPTLVSNLYGESALYLAPGREIQKGREAIHKTFKGFFDWAKEKGRKLDVAFQIVERGVSENFVYDVGVYTLKGMGGGMPDSEDRGKFVVVARRGDDGKWHFQVDGYSGIKPN